MLSEFASRCAYAEDATAERSRIAWAVRRAIAMTVSIGLTPGRGRQRGGIADPDARGVVQLPAARRRPRSRGRRPCRQEPIWWAEQAVRSYDVRSSRAT